MSAGDAFEPCLRLAIVFGNTAAYRAGATGILRRHRMNVAAQSQRLPIKLGEKYPPALIENRTVETALLCNASAGLLNSSLRGCRHVFDLQVLSENLCVVLTDSQRDLFDETTTDIGDMLMKPCNRYLLFAPIIPELLDGAAVTKCCAGKCRKSVPTCVRVADKNLCRFSGALTQKLLPSVSAQLKRHRFCQQFCLTPARGFDTRQHRDLTHSGTARMATPVTRA